MGISTPKIDPAEEMFRRDVLGRLDVIAETLALVMLAMGGTPIAKDVLVKHVLACGVRGNPAEWFPEKKLIVEPSALPLRKMH